MHVDASQDQSHIEKLSQVLGCSFFNSRWLSVMSDDGELLAVVAYYGFSEGNCEFSVATFGKCNFSRSVLRELFAWPFQQLRLRRVTAVSSFRNPRAINQLERLGFVREGIARNWFPDAHGMILGMTQEECKWLS